MTSIDTTIASEGGTRHVHKTGPTQNQRKNDINLSEQCQEGALSEQRTGVPPGGKMIKYE